MKRKQQDGYLAPEHAKSPAPRWKQHRVIYNSDSSGTTFASWSLAVGYWDGKAELGLRWNGDDETPLGSPKSHAYGTWFIVPKPLHLGVLAQVEHLVPHKVKEAIYFLLGGNF